MFLFREINSRGYCGCETRLKEFVCGLAPVTAALPVVRFEAEQERLMQRAETLIVYYDIAFLAFGGVPLALLWQIS